MKFKKLSLETEGACAVVNEINNFFIGKIAINRLSLIISTQLLFSLLPNQRLRVEMANCNL